MSQPLCPSDISFRHNKVHVCRVSSVLNILNINKQNCSVIKLRCSSQTVVLVPE